MTAMAGWISISVFTPTIRGTQPNITIPSPYYDAENGPPNFLMRNQRDGTFRDVTADSGLDQQQHAIQLLLRLE